MTHVVLMNPRAPLPPSGALVNVDVTMIHEISFRCSIHCSPTDASTYQQLQPHQSNVLPPSFMHYHAPTLYLAHHVVLTLGSYLRASTTTSH